MCKLTEASLLQPTVCHMGQWVSNALPNEASYTSKVLSVGQREGANMSLLPVQLLLDHGADPNQRDGLGNTPLHLGKCQSDELCMQRNEVTTAFCFSSASSFFLCITL